MSDDASQGLDYELDDVVTVETPLQMRAIGDSLRWLLLDLVLERAMTVSELAAVSGKAKGTIAHHVNLLVGAGLMKVVRTRKVRAVEERFYGRTARTVNLPKAEAVPDFLDTVRTELDPAGIDCGAFGESTLRHARIPAERAAEYGKRLLELALEFSAEPRAGDREYGLLVMVYPTNRPVSKDNVQ